MQTPISLQRIRRLSILLATACLVMIVALPSLILIAWYFGSPSEIAVQAGLKANAIQQPLAAWQRIVGALVTEIPATLFGVGLWHARGCFLLFAAARYFDIAVVRRLQGFAAWVCTSVIVSIFTGALLSALLTINNGPGTKQLTVGFGSNQLFPLFVAGMVWVIASVMAHASAIADEHAQFV